MALSEFFYCFLNYPIDPFESRVRQPKSITFKLVQKDPGWRYVCVDCALVDGSHNWDRYATGIFPRTEEEKASHRQHEPPPKATVQMMEHAEDHARFAQWMNAHQ